jgi:serine/threonine protein kinase
MDHAMDADPTLVRAEARIGKVLRDKWTIERLLGVGGMAAVYAGTHRNGKRGAIKILHLELSLDGDARRRFLQEGYAANRVDHPGAVSVLDDDVAEDGSVFLVMELLEGRSVEAIARAEPSGRLDVGAALGVMDQVLDVLAAAHDKGIVHRDLKPENLFVTEGGAVKVLDFGIARVHEHRSGAGATRTGCAMGTPAFMAPEQALGNWSEVDARTDLWAIGASLFALLTGRLVHEAANVQQIMLAAMTRSAPPIRSIAPEIPAPIAAVVDRALSFERDARWPDARSMQRALREAGRGVEALLPAGSAAPPPRGARGEIAAVSTPSLLGATLAIPARPRRSPGLAALAVGITLAAAIGLVLVWRPWSSPPDASAITAPSPAARTPASPVQPAVTASPEITAAPVDPAPTVSTAAGAASASATSTGAASASATVAPRSTGRAPPPRRPDPGAREAPDPFGKWK